MSPAFRYEWSFAAQARSGLGVGEIPEESQSVRRRPIRFANEIARNSTATVDHVADRHAPHGDWSRLPIPDGLDQPSSRIKRGREPNPQIVEKGSNPRRTFPVNRDGRDLHLGSEQFCQTLQRRELAPAWRAPGRPDADQPRLADGRSEVERGAVDKFKSNCGHGGARFDKRELAARRPERRSCIGPSLSGSDRQDRCRCCDGLKNGPAGNLQVKFIQHLCRVSQWSKLPCGSCTGGAENAPLPPARRASAGNDGVRTNEP